MGQESRDQQTTPAHDADESRAAMAYRPPYDLTADMLIAFALLPTRPLRQAFPRVPFLSVLGRTLTIVWFSQVIDGWYSDGEGGRHQLADGHTPLYAELNVLAALWRRAVFVPGIYATSALSIEIGHRYGMPKQSISMRFAADDGECVLTEAADGGHKSTARGLLVGSGRLLTAVAAHILPRRFWPARFPSGGAVRVLIQGVSAVRLVRIRDGRLMVGTSWLPRPVRLLPGGIYVPRLRMQLPS